MTEFILKRAQCADALGNYEKAIQDYQTVLKDPHVPPDLIMDVNYYFACALYNYALPANLSAIAYRHRCYGLSLRILSNRQLF